MHAVPEPATERVIALMTEMEKAKLEQKARRAAVSVGELVRLSVDSDDPDEVALLTHPRSQRF